MVAVFRSITAEQVEKAVEKAKEHSRTIVEKMIDGFDHRMLVIDGELVAVAKRVPGHVVGDGTHTIAELVDIVNQDPRRGVGHEKVLTRLELDYQAERLMQKAGFTAETVLPENEVFYLRATGNLSTGGTAIDMTDHVHHDNRDMAMRAARAIGLDVAGVDFITPDITRSYREVGGAICEVNAAPGFRMHVAPTEGTPRDVAGPVMDMLFPCVAYSHCSHYRNQRKNHHITHGGPYSQDVRLHRRTHHHRWCVHRWGPHKCRGYDRSDICENGATRPESRCSSVGNGPRWSASKRTWIPLL